MLVDVLRQIDVVLNNAKKKAPTDAGPTSSKVCISKRGKCEISERNRAHKWLGCMISTDDGGHGLDPEHHFQAAAKFFYANKPLVEKCHGMGDWTGKNWKTKEHMGYTCTPDGNF